MGGWCKILDKFVQSNEPAANALKANYIVVKINYGDGNNNEEVLGQYPEIRAYPHIFVLESDGTLLHSQGSGELEEGKSYDPAVFLAFLQKWAPDDKE